MFMSFESLKFLQFPNIVYFITGSSTPNRFGGGFFLQEAKYTFFKITTAVTLEPIVQFCCALRFIWQIDIFFLVFVVVVS